MEKENYNWWDDQKNKEEVDRISWWNHEKNKETFSFPISVVNDGEYWIATCNNETEKLLGDKLHACAQGETKDEAISKMFMMIRMTHDYSEECRLNYQRFVPFRKGDWKHTGGKWVVIFGIHIYFRYGKGMKGGAYLPLTKLNVSLLNEWKNYNKFKKSSKE
jgi:hypothetical protein